MIMAYSSWKSKIQYLKYYNITEVFNVSCDKVKTRDIWLAQSLEDLEWQWSRTADLTVDQKTLNDRGVSRWRSYAERAGCSQSDASKHSCGKLTVRENVDLWTFSRSWLWLETVHQEPPCTDVPRKLVTSDMFLVSSRSWSRDNIRSMFLLFRW